VLVQRIVSGGLEVYSGTVTLAFLKKAFNHSLPFKKELFPPLEREEKAIDEIARLIVHRIMEGEAWWMGGFSFAIYPFPLFQPLKLEQNEKEDCGIWGQLHLVESGPEVWFPLEGYQRMQAMFQALSMLPKQKRRVLEENMVSVLLLPPPSFVDCNELLLRMHKSSRAIDRGKAIRTTINDDYAVYARRLMGEEEAYPEIIKKDLINWQSNTLTNRLEKFSTLSVLYDSTKMLDQAFEQTLDKEQRYYKIAGIWSLLLERFTLFRQVMSTPKQLSRLRSQFLCLKPTGQLIIIAVIVLALQIHQELPLEEVIERLNKVPWEIDQPYWQNIVVVDGRVNGTGAAIHLASRFVGYLINLPLSDVEVQALEVDYGKAKRDKNAPLPNPLFPKKDE
jgi:DNA-sulfur modification-associated